MATFPTRESDIVVLAQSIVQGLDTQAGTFAKPPYSGQCRVLEIGRKGDGWVFLDWKEPADGGKPNFYTVEKRELPDGPWQPAATVVESEATLVNQPKGKLLEYRVFAVNKAGNGAYSNVVDAVV